MATKLPSGKYRAQASYYDAAGKRRRISFTRRTAREADYAALEYQMRQKRESAPGGLSVQQAVERYIENGSAVFSPSTVVGYRSTLRNYLKPIAEYRLDRLTSELLQAWLNELAAAHSPKTVRNAWGLMAAALKVYRPDFVPAVKLPRKRHSEMIIPSTAQVEEILNEAAGTSAYLPLLLSAHCGLRRSEAAALTWNDVDLARRKIHVRGAVVKGEDGWVQKGTKTDAGYRSLPMTPAVYECLKAADRSRPPVTLSPNNISKRFAAICKRLGYPFHQHLLRHYYASVQIAAGIPLFYVQKRMGHGSDEMLKRVYAHTMQEMEAKMDAQSVAAFATK